MAFRHVRLQGWETPLVLLGIVLLSYGLWIPWLGLFGNDLPYLWYYHLLGPWGPGEFAAIDRPLSAVFYAASTFLLGEAVWPYHVFLLGLRWLSGILLWWVLGLVWPEHKREAALAAVLFVVYPGFRQSPVALEFILHFFVLDLFLASLGTMLLSTCQPRRYWPLALATALGTGGLFWLEYFFGLEILRPIFLWFFTRRQGLRGKQQWQRIMLAWLPAIVVVLAFLVWRVFIFSFPTYGPVLLSELRASPLAGLAHLGKMIVHDVWIASAEAWRQVLQIPNGLRAVLAYIALAVASFALVTFLWWKLGKTALRFAKNDHWGEVIAMVGLLAMLAGGAIFWVTTIPVTLDFPWDRSTLSFMLGASLLVTGMIVMIVVPRYQPVLIGGLVALAVGMHFINAQEYRAEWQKLQDFTWQLTWRAPGLQPGTLGLFDVIPLNRYSDNDLTALLNWTYAPAQHDRNISYKFMDLTLRMEGDHPGLPGVEKDLLVEVSQRGTLFKSTTSSTLALLYNPPACLRLLGPEDASLPNLPERIARVLPITRLEQIIDTAASARPPAQLGGEPEHGWCYYFQRADLARQMGDWAAVDTLDQQASAAGLAPKELSELLPFIEGAIGNENYARAEQLTNQALQQANLKPVVCAIWKKMGVKEIPRKLSCQP